MSEMLESIAPELWLVAAGVALLIGLASFAAGRRTGSQAEQIKELTGALDDAQADAADVRAELDGYRGSVSDHFAETSEKLRDLTLQYRVVYDHLAAGANKLCPEAFEQLGGGLATDALPETLAEEELETDDLALADLEPALDLGTESEPDSAPEVVAAADADELSAPGDSAEAPERVPA